MSEAISYEHIPQEAKQGFQQRLQVTPEHRAEVVQDAYAILQLLHDQGILGLVKDALGSTEKVMDVVIGMMESEQVVRTIRNLKTLAKLIGAVEPETLEKIIAQFNRSQG